MGGGSRMILRAKFPARDIANLPILCTRVGVGKGEGLLGYALWVEMYSPNSRCL